MTPAEHYAEAEIWIDKLDNLDASDPASLGAYRTFLQRAQVHATLATVNPNVLWPLREAMSDG